MENNKSDLERPQEKPRASSRIFGLITGLTAVVLAGAVMVCLGLYQQNQRLEKELQPATTAEVKTFNLQDDISISLPKSWVVSTATNDSNILIAARFNNAGRLIAELKIFSEKLEYSYYNQEYIKNLSAIEKNKLAKEFADIYESSEFDSAVNIENRRIVDYKIINLNGFFTVLLVAKGKFDQDKVTDEARYICFRDHIVSIDLVWFDSNYSLLSLEIDTILKSIIPGRQ